MNIRILLSLLILSQFLWAAPQKESILEYDFNGKELKTNEQILVDIPAVMQNRAVDFVSIGHRQDPSEEGECVQTTPGWDCLPAYSSVEFNDKKLGWRYWGGVGSGPLNSKFAEIRTANDPEIDNLYQWRHYGHGGVNGGGMSYDAINPTQVRVRSVGPDSVHIHKLIIKFLPPAPTKLEDVVFSDQYAFGAYDTYQGSQIPGAADSTGDYANALSIGWGGNSTHKKLPSNWIVSGNQIKIPLTAGKKLSFVDIGVGDMKRVPPGGNPDNYRGGAKLTAKTASASFQDTLCEYENIGSNGTMRCLPTSHQRKLENNEYLTITILNDAAQIMGIRIGYID